MLPPRRRRVEAIATREALTRIVFVLLVNADAEPGSLVERDCRREFRQAIRHSRGTASGQNCFAAASVNGELEIVPPGVSVTAPGV